MRFKELKESEMTEAQREISREVRAGPRGRLGPPTSVILRSPGLARHTQKVGEHLRYGSQFSGRIMEFAILIAARHWNADYVWHAHHPLAIKAGLGAAVAADLAHGRHPSGMKADEAAAYEFCTELQRDKAVSDATFDAAIRHFGEEGVVDLMGALAYYSLHSMALKVNQVRAPDVSPSPMPPLG